MITDAASEFSDLGVCLMGQLNVTSHHDSDSHVMECSHLLEEEVGSHEHLLSHDNRHYCLYSACHSGQLCKELNGRYQLDVHVE